MDNIENTTMRLPVGTLVTIENLERPVVIIGHEILLESEGRRFNYMGVEYPSGFHPEGNFAFFNKEQIIDILNLGLLHPEHALISDMLDMEFKVGMYSEVTDVDFAEVEEEQEDYLEL